MFISEASISGFEIIIIFMCFLFSFFFSAFNDRRNLFSAQEIALPSMRINRILLSLFAPSLSLMITDDQAWINDVCIGENNPFFAFFDVNTPV